MRLLPLAFFFVFANQVMSAQYVVGSDSVVVQAEGRILNAETKEPISARITYHSLPYGNKVGVISGTNYVIPLYDGQKYALTVEATGFNTAKYTIDPSLADEAGKVIKDIELGIGPQKNGHDVGHVLRLDNLIFQLGKDKISEESYAELDDVVAMMKENHKMVIQLEGHTDYQGDPKQNLKLSQQRVKAVKDYLVSHGIHKKRVLTKAFGGTKPLSREGTPEAHRLNRRVELRILEY